MKFQYYRMHLYVQTPSLLFEIRNFASWEIHSLFKTTFPFHPIIGLYLLGKNYTVIFLKCVPATYDYEILYYKHQLVIFDMLSSLKF